MQTGPHYWRRAPMVLPLLVFMITVVEPMLGRSYAVCLLGFYLMILIPVAIRPMPKPVRIPFLYAYIVINIFALIFHFWDVKSVLNVGAMLISIVTIAALAYYCVRVYGHIAVDRSLEISLWISLVISIFLSIMLTAVDWHGAPEYFPWEALYSGKRLLLIVGGHVGHSPSLWVIAFLSAFTLHRLLGEKRARVSHMLLFIFLLVLLFASKSRLAIVYLINFIIMGLAYFRVPLMRSMVFLFPLVVSMVFFVLISVPMLSANFNVISHEAQKSVTKLVRIAPQNKHQVFSGRGILNIALFRASLKQPFEGLGDGADILIYGIDANGGVAYGSRRKIALSESILRLAVKYGWIYFAVVVSFLLSIPWYFRKFERKERILKIGLWGMCIESVLLEGGMETLYGLSGLFLFILCLFLFEAILNRWFKFDSVIESRKFSLPSPMDSFTKDA